MFQESNFKAKILYRIVYTSTKLQELSHVLGPLIQKSCMEILGFLDEERNNIIVH